jgi:hypothetical protein
MELFATPISSPILITLTIIYAITSSIETFDIRILQGKKRGILPPDTLQLPEWTGIFIYLSWLTWIGILLLNWVYALALFGIKFILKVLPVLERIGGFIVGLFIGNQLPKFVAYSDSLHQQKAAADGLSLMTKGNKTRSADQLHSYLEKVKSQDGMPMSLKLVTSISAIKTASITDNKKQELEQVVMKLYKE